MRRRPTPSRRERPTNIFQPIYLPRVLQAPRPTPLHKAPPTSTGATRSSTTDSRERRRFPTSPHSPILLPSAPSRAARGRALSSTSHTAARAPPPSAKAGSILPAAPPRSLQARARQSTTSLRLRRPRQVHLPPACRQHISTSPAPQQRQRLRTDSI